jgi:hypothetical protein
MTTLLGVFIPLKPLREGFAGVHPDTLRQRASVVRREVRNRLCHASPLNVTAGERVAMVTKVLDLAAALPFPGRDAVLAELTALAQTRPPHAQLALAAEPGALAAESRRVVMDYESCRTALLEWGSEVLATVRENNALLRDMPHAVGQYVADALEDGIRRLSLDERRRLSLEEPRVGAEGRDQAGDPWTPKVRSRVGRRPHPRGCADVVHLAFRLYRHGCCQVWYAKVRYTSQPCFSVQRSPLPREKLENIAQALTHPVSCAGSDNELAQLLLDHPYDKSENRDILVKIFQRFGICRGGGTKPELIERLRNYIERGDAGYSKGQARTPSKPAAGAGGQAGLRTPDQPPHSLVRVGQTTAPGSSGSADTAKLLPVRSTISSRPRLPCTNTQRTYHGRSLIGLVGTWVGRRARRPSRSPRVISRPCAMSSV